MGWETPNRFSLQGKTYQAGLQVLVLENQVSSFCFLEMVVQRKRLQETLLQQFVLDKFHLGRHRVRLPVAVPGSSSDTAVADEDAPSSAQGPGCCSSDKEDKTARV